ncbi:hypothetical protein DIPPA_35290 [Diplonema papillatum]|nr:hypothetical protein DIPPA_35290 [Diplonema papillatum]
MAEDEKRCGEEMKKKALGHGERAAGPGGCGSRRRAAGRRQDRRCCRLRRRPLVAGVELVVCDQHRPQQREEAVASRPAPSPERARVQDAQNRIHPTSGLALMLGPGCREETDDDETGTVEIHYSQDDDQMFFFSDDDRRKETPDRGEGSHLAGIKQDEWQCSTRQRHTGGIHAFVRVASSS